MEELGFLPLAIEQAAAFIREASKNIFAFLDTYRSHQKELLARLPKGNLDYTDSVATTWLVSLEALRAQNEKAVTL